MLGIDLNRGALAAPWRDDPCGVLYSVAARHPGEQVALLLGEELVLLVQDAASARHVLIGNVSNYHKNFGPFVRFFGHSRLTSDGPLWQKLQALSRPYLLGVDPNRVADSARRHAASATNAILSDAAISPLVALDDHLGRLTAAVIAEVALGFHPDDISPDFVESFGAILRYASATAWNLQGASPGGNTAERAAALAARARLEEGIASLAIRRAAAPAPVPGLFEALVAAQDAELDLFGEVCTLLFAGFETSATALGWALWLLAADPELQGRMRTAAREGDASLDVAAIEAEVLRIFPPIPMLSRVAQHSDVIAGTPVLPGTKVIVSTIGLHHDPSVFQSPAQINLDRFRNGRIPRSLIDHWLPFGTGSRGCPGSQIAKVEILTALSVLIDRMKVERPVEDRVNFEWAVSMRRRGGQRLVISAAD